MSFIAAVGAVKRVGFWRALAQALDHYTAERMQRAVPEMALRRSKHEIDRCRRLMLKNSLAPVEAGVNSASLRRVALTQPR
jgi:hypothetical protein